MKYIGRHGWVMESVRIAREIRAGRLRPPARYGDEMSTELPPELAEHQAEVKAEVKARYQQRHGRDTLLQMRAELMALPDPVDNAEAEGRVELLAWMDAKLEAIDTAEAHDV